ncbi:FeoC-like transcriptional regulator [methane-oxidizing endosymbiont of Gigantopelta aegis]|uniref:FeoC-like transcriptional regulator n=1 Tax=methane-oxidizing endosymbiont of Gigantopelta aegis TaxID=2794938 RepID=UPI0018DD70B6|nr:FeoC-like transcriptional regulator [methane-oxidizing endosymbiont of Gigantopelta aegis]
MILSEIRNYVRDKKRCTLNELVMHFDVDAEAMRGMLSKWAKKGKIRQIPVSSSCGSSCHKCNPELTELYEWIE